MLQIVQFELLLWYRGAATDEREAQELGKALCATGVVLRFRNNVFLRPEEVMQSVLRVRPTCHQVLQRYLSTENIAQLAAAAESILGVARRPGRLPCYMPSCRDVALAQGLHMAGWWADQASCEQHAKSLADQARRAVPRLHQ